MTDGEKQLRKDFESFREECIWASIVLNTHQTLFDGGADTDRILKDSAAWFFYDLSVILQEYFTILVGRLTDPASTRKNKSLTASYIVEQIEGRGHLPDEIREAACALEKYRSRILEARNKLVAHRDVTKIRSQAKPKSWPKEEVTDFRDNLNRFCDLIAQELDLAPEDFRSVPSQGDAVDLLKLLENTHGARQ